MTVQIGANGVNGDLDLWNREARGLLTQLGFRGEGNLDRVYNASDMAKACDRWLERNQTDIPSSPPSFGRPTTGDFSELVIGLRYLAEQASDGKVRFE